MKFLPLVFFLALHALPSFAQDSPRYNACIKKANTQSEMNTCASQESARADSDLNLTYRKLLSKATTPDAVQKIRDAERAWIAYRDATLEAAFPAKDKQLEYGSIYPMEVNLLRAKLTRRHIATLHDLVQRYSH
jgi:uncharacterized protein YecT (DUF1311 family)